MPLREKKWYSYRNVCDTRHESKRLRKIKIHTYQKGKTQGKCKTQLKRERKHYLINTMTMGGIKKSFLTTLQQYLSSCSNQMPWLPKQPNASFISKHLTYLSTHVWQNSSNSTEMKLANKDSSRSKKRRMLFYFQIFPKSLPSQHKQIAGPPIHHVHSNVLK